MKTDTQKTRDEIFSQAEFEWIRTERSGDLCQFSRFEENGGVEYVVFTDGTRIKTSLIGDIVLMHTDSSQVLGRDLLKIEKPIEDILGIPVDQSHLNVQPQTQQISSHVISSDNSAVIAILEKSKKRNEKINLSLTVKIPSPDLYSVMKENFENVDDVLLQNVLEQIDEKILKESIRRELISIYQKKKKTSQ